MSLFVTFQEWRNAVITALYKRLYSSDDDTDLTASEIKKVLSLSVGQAFLIRVLDDLSEEQILNSSFDSDFGVSRYSLTSKGIISAEKLIAGTGLEDPVEGVPASDRLVSVTDNQRNLIISTLSEIREMVRSSNNLSESAPVDKDRIVAELSASSALITSEKVRYAALVGLIGPPLRFLAEKFSESMIGELAKKLLELIWNVVKT